MPDTFLGDPVYFDPRVASMASDARIVAYGDFSKYWIRDTGSSDSNAATTSRSTKSGSLPRIASIGRRRH
jgi:HK97 family phage major capsid protein